MTMDAQAAGDRTEHRPPIDVTAFEAVLFDLDGVLTKTAAVHAAAWKRLFDEFLKEWSAREGKPFEPFDINRDYRRYVDGKLRYDGVRSFLDSRGIALPLGQPGDGPDQQTVHGLGDKKDGYFQAHLKEHGVELYDDALEFLRGVRAKGLRTAVVSASKSAGEVVEAVGLTSCFDARVDGIESGRLHLKGKPAPDGFLEGARRLGVAPAKAIVVEDAVSGVQAGQAGGFGLVVGVDRTGHAEDLRRNGATVVTQNLAELIR
jgi:beta-phosphoglucomutase family hydrolase